MKTLILIITTFILGLLKTYSQEPSYDVVFAISYYTQYISEIKKDTTNNYKKLFLDIVRTPIFQRFFMQSEYASFVYEDLARPSLDIPHLKKTLVGINSNKKEIEKIIKKALNKCNQHLKSDKVTIYVIPPSSELKTMMGTMQGILGFTAGSKQIIISIDTSIEGWKKMLPYAIAHEYNHMYWTKENFAKLTQWTLLDYLVFEGRGDYFAKLLYPKVNTPWTASLTPEEKQKLWIDIQPHLDNQDFSFQAEVMFGSQRFPAWGGYALGYDIVQSSLSKDKSTFPNAWVNYNSQKLLNSSDYKNE